MAVADLRSAPHNKLKQLQTERAKAVDRLSAMNAERVDISGRIVEASAEISRIDAEIEALKQSDIVITEHALLRYLERVKGIDLAAVREEILTPTVREQIALLPSGTFPVNDFKLRVKQRTVVTILTKDGESA